MSLGGRGGRGGGDVIAAVCLFFVFDGGCWPG